LVGFDAALFKTEQWNAMHEIPETNTLGKASLFLSIPALSFVFCTGLCAGVGKEQGWLANVGTLLFLCGATAAFVGLLAGLIGLVGIFARPRAAALVGVVLGIAAVLLFGAILNAIK
jgi:hypothetical protein